MATVRKSSETPRRRRRPATTPEARENQLISSAFELAERQLEAGTASAQVITHYLKLGTVREKLEREKLQQENELLKAKIESMNSMHRTEEMYSKALSAMRQYSGQEVESDEYED